MPRKEYIQKIITNIRKIIEEAPENIEATKVCGETAYTLRWAEVNLLCDVVEEYILTVKGE